jgi:hypothetical protein
VVDVTEPALTSYESTIQGSHVAMRVAGANYHLQHFADDHIKQIMAKKLVDFIIRNKLCKFTIDVERDQLIAEMFLVPNDQVKILRHLGVLK